MEHFWNSCAALLISRQKVKYPTNWNKRVRHFASVSGGLLMQVKDRAMKTSHALCGEKSNEHKLNLQIVAFFYWEFIDYFRLGRSTFFSIMVILYKCLQYNLIYFYKKAFFLVQRPFRSIRTVLCTSRKFKTRCHFTKNLHWNTRKLDCPLHCCLNGDHS